jgi:CubicO group peptidase (beta-lactamase class C family)
VWLIFRFFSLLLISLPPGSLAASENSYDYFSANRQLVRNGLQAVLMCNGLYTSNRHVSEIFEQELAYLAGARFGGIVGNAGGGDYQINSTLKSVSVGGGATGPSVSAVFREGIGCIVMSPGQGLGDISALPLLKRPPNAVNPDTIPWPSGDLVPDEPLPEGINPKALKAASDWTFNRPIPEEITTGLIIMYQGKLIHERYAAGFDRHTRTRTWSTAKSIAATLIGILVDDGRLKLDEPLGIEWVPALKKREVDPRNGITLRHLLNMSSGLYPVDSINREYTTGSSRAYWAGASAVKGARNRGLVREPGTYWDYENFDTLLAVYAMKLALGDDEVYQEFPQRALLDRIGMRSTLIGTDRFHDFVLSSQVYTNARDLARFGLLYAQGGTWQGERIISEAWIAFVRTPAPSTSKLGNFYGGQWWLVPDDRDDVPRSAYATAGTRGQFVIVVPSHDLVIVRRGLDYSKKGFDQWDLAREVVKAIR